MTDGTSSTGGSSRWTIPRLRPADLGMQIPEPLWPPLPEPELPRPARWLWRAPRWLWRAVSEMILRLGRMGHNLFQLGEQLLSQDIDA